VADLPVLMNSLNGNTRLYKMKALPRT
jgi:hypothetical protein